VINYQTSYPASRTTSASLFPVLLHGFLQYDIPTHIPTPRSGAEQTVVEITSCRLPITLHVSLGHVFKGKLLVVLILCLFWFCCSSCKTLLWYGFSSLFPFSFFRGYTSVPYYTVGSWQFYQFYDWYWQIHIPPWFALCCVSFSKTFCWSNQQTLGGFLL